ncbi:FUSC family protein [Streptomyces tubbatahanensis]|uniref:FUSC family protein n=1 Tax=Streptomyces tubbatahanensis TaxID=2923272 RepID=A0ABY3XVU9_9ACTN|nr:FUSC family protein [Streptomyces tubbatahanensis]UNS98565.1 FUSC family protein [Streptomyces tubbatahanensis]
MTPQQTARVSPGGEEPADTDGVNAGDGAPPSTGTETGTGPNTGAGADAGGEPGAAAPHAPRRVSGPRHWWDWVLAADPGLGQLQAGWRTLTSMVTALAVGYGMSVATGVSAMLGMMVGGMIGLMSSFAVAENTPLRLTRAILWLPVPFSAILPVSAWLHQDRVLELCLMGVAIALLFFLLKFGTIALLTGMMMFNAFLVGMMTPIPLHSCGWLFVIAVTTAVAVVGVRLLLCYPMPREDLLRTQRAFVVEARRVADAAATALDPDADAAVATRRMRRALRRLNVTTLTIDGNLAQPEVAAEPEAAELLHQYLFDAELALQGIGQATQQLTRRHVPSRLREALVVGLVLARDTHLGRADALRPAAELIRQQATAPPHAGTAQEDDGGEEAEVRAAARRVADLLDALADALACWLSLGWNSPTARAKVPFKQTVLLERGRPAASGPAAQRVAEAQVPDTGWRRAVPYLRAPLTAGLAAAITIPLADAINGQRFYWGLIGVMITLFGTNTTHERLRKFAHRMVGTAIGAVLGIALLHAVGHGHVYAMLTVIVAGITFGAWGMSRAYALWVVGLVVALTQLYGLTTPYDGMDRLLTERLVENGLGVLVATACAAAVFPVATSKVRREAARGYLSALEDLIAQVATRWKEPEAPIRLRGAARAVDAALYQMQSVVRPLVRMPLGARGRTGDNLLALLGTATRHARSLAVAADVDLDAAPELRVRVDRITEVFAGSLRSLDRQLATGGGKDGDGTWVRVSPLIRELEASPPALSGPRAERSAPDRSGADRLRAALRELAALDEVLASLADNRGMRIVLAPAVDPHEGAGGEAAAPAVHPVPGANVRPPSAPRAHRQDLHRALAAQAFAASAARHADPRVDRADPRVGRAGTRPGDADTRSVRAGAAEWSGPVSPAGQAPGTSGERTAAAPAPAPALLPTAGTGTDRADEAGVRRGTGAGAGAVGAVTVDGFVHCPLHPGGCEAWLTVVDARGKRQALVRTVGGAYQVTGLTPGGHTLVTSSASHAPSAEFLLVTGAAGTMRHDVALRPAP